MPWPEFDREACRGRLGPLGPDLNVVKDWNLAEFIATMRNGIDPNGHEISQANAVASDRTNG